MNFKEAILEMLNGKEMECTGTPWRFTEQFQYQSGSGEWHNCATIVGYNQQWRHYNPELDFFQAVELLKQGKSVRRKDSATRLILENGKIRLLYLHTCVSYACIMETEAKYVEVK